jgi:Big-like domain-containing protein/PKD domain-containing protein
MVTRCRQLAVVAAAIVIFAAAACEQSPLLAPSGSTITLTAPINAVPSSGSVEIVAQVLEPAGTPPHSGTEVTFTTTLGVVSPAVAETDAGGRAVARFQANGANGTATISATSGGAATSATGTLRISVGSASVGAIKLGANPATVGALGGSTTISASVLDVNGNVLPQVAVTFTTTAGTLSSQLVISDANGIAQTFLTTSQQATVTASVGAQGGSTTAPTPPSTGTGGTTPTTPTPTTPSSSGTATASITVTVAAAPSILITPPTVSPTKGLPATFTFVVTAATQNGSAIRSVSINWGDSSASQNVGSFTGSQPVSHVYERDGSFTVTATVTDVAGQSNSASTSVFVTPAVQVGITITSSPVPAKVNTQTLFTIQITAPTGVGIVNTTIDYGDGFQDSLGGGATPQARHTYTVGGTYTVTVRTIDTAGTTSIGTTTVSVGL